MTAKKGNHQEEIPIITDAVVVTDDGATQNHSMPPAVNPAYHSTQIVPTAGSQGGALVPTNQAAHKVQPSKKVALYYNLGRNPTGLKCPHCQRETVTTTHDLIGVGTIMAVLLLAFIFVPICWLPLCIPSCHRTQHFCCHNECRQKVGETSVCA